MEKFRSVLLGVWQEACRHIEIDESTKTIAAMLVRHMPIERLLVRRIDTERSCLDGGNTRTECSAGEMKRLLRWCKRGKVAHLGKLASRDADLGFIVPEGINADVLAGPLGECDNPSGVLLLVAPAGRAFNAQDKTLAGVLLDPLSVALDNDRRLREMAALREAAEADKNSLLTRLGRKKLGDTIVGADSGLRAVMERVELVARSDVPALIFGETGTGKELIARAIHTRSPRAAGPVIRVNCGAIPPELIDSELFGHERGAFTGAVESRKGWFERADGGTLFLDEIGELPPAAQVRLLRILQDGNLERVGGQHNVHVDVRIVAATHRELSVMVSEGTFREDLWYRIAVFPIFLPSLRERCEDISELARHFAQRAATRFGLPPTMPTPEDITRLTSYHWPGNVRELGTVIDRAAILGDGERLEIAKALGVTPSVAGPQLTQNEPKSAEFSSHNKVEPLDVAIKRHIETALVVTAGCIEGPRGAAVLLKINPHTLRAKMRKLGIDWRQFRKERRKREWIVDSG